MDGSHRQEKRGARMVMFYKIVNGLVAVEGKDYLTPGLTRYLIQK